MLPNPDSPCLRPFFFFGPLKAFFFLCQKFFLSTRFYARIVDPPFPVLPFSSQLFDDQGVHRTCLSFFLEFDIRQIAENPFFFLFTACVTLFIAFLSNFIFFLVPVSVLGPHESVPLVALSRRLNHEIFVASPPLKLLWTGRKFSLKPASLLNCAPPGAFHIFFLSPWPIKLITRFDF